MRESKIFAKRAKVLESDEVIRKYFLIYEGSNTEVIYFDAVCSLREDIGINPLIELVPIMRSFSEEGWSNPKKILDRVIENLQESKNKYISYESLLNRIMDYLDDIENVTISKAFANEIWETMKWACLNKLQKSLSDMVDDIESSCKIIFEVLKDKYDLINIVEDITDIIKNGGLTYDEGFDQICLIVDRDKNSFVSNPENNQYKYVLEKCEEMGFHFCITNPCFEFWLLLHFDEVFDLDKEMLLNNPQITSKRRYAENELHTIFPEYNKNRYPAETLVRKIDKAIENEKRFCENIEQLEYSVGSNIGKLIENMRVN